MLAAEENFYQWLVSASAAIAVPNVIKAVVIAT